jgi:hypothetical protein
MCNCKPRDLRVDQLAALTYRLIELLLKRLSDALPLLCLLLPLSPVTSPATLSQTSLAPS